MNFKPNMNRLLVKRDESQKTYGNLHIPETAAQVSQSAEVIAVGEGSQYFHEGDIVTIPVKYKTGDKVLIPKFGTTAVKIDNEEYDLLAENEVLGLL